MYLLICFRLFCCDVIVMFCIAALHVYSKALAKLIREKRSSYKVLIFYLFKHILEFVTRAAYQMFRKQSRQYYWFSLKPQLTVK